MSPQSLRIQTSKDRFNTGQYLNTMNIQNTTNSRITIPTLQVPESNKVTCLSCQNNQLQCDKTLPVCKKCQSKGVDCIYIFPNTNKTTSKKSQSANNKKSKKHSSKISKQIRKKRTASTATTTTTYPPLTQEISAPYHHIQSFGTINFGEPLAPVTITGGLQDGFVMPMLPNEPNPTLPALAPRSADADTNDNINQNTNTNVTSSPFTNWLRSSASVTPISGVYPWEGSLSGYPMLSPFQAQTHVQVQTRDQSQAPTQTQDQNQLTLIPGLPFTGTNLKEILALSDFDLTLEQVSKFHEKWFDLDRHIFTYSKPRYLHYLETQPLTLLHYSYLIWALICLEDPELEDKSRLLYQRAVELGDKYWDTVRNTSQFNSLYYLHYLVTRLFYEFSSGDELKCAFTLARAVRLAQMFGYDQLDISQTTLLNPSIFLRKCTSGQTSSNSNSNNSYQNSSVSSTLSPEGFNALSGNTDSLGGAQIFNGGVPLAGAQIQVEEDDGLDPDLSLIEEKRRR
ncbi:unnamed protein product [Ambrosiozyma monospora]|uniref:Unnamed protein product n=1 Tax=Ambrosiozyma monospora TaxID=43982 RepID=A0ACB5SWX0_AMBMO|nr:unnamed protein product [Ambrosiozyma monospora]